MSDYRAFFANCVLGGSIDVHLDGFDVEIIPLPGIANSPADYRGRSVHTADLYIRDMDLQQFAAAEELARDVAALLSFATASEVVCFGYEYPDRDPFEQFRSYVAQLQNFRPTLEVQNAAVMGQFLEMTFPTYRQLVAQRQLNIAFSYYVLSQKEGLPVELHLLSLFILLEQLKHTFAPLHGFPLIRNRFRNMGATIANPGRPASFQSMLTPMFAAVGMAPNLGPIINLRNRLIHSGLTHLNFADMWDMLCAIEDIVREYLLRVLNYHGPYRRFSDLAVANI
jgi:hypothetical protein